MEGTNGSAKGPRNPKAMNGVNGINGLKSSSLNGHAVGPRTRAAPKRRSFVGRSFSIIARLLTWYSIFTILFRCPATLDECDETSGKICKPYFQLKNTVTPHIEPYYNTHARPYVDAARPYYEAADRAVLTPARAYAAKYGAPRVAQAQAFSHAQWEKTVQPQFVKYQQLAKSKYGETLAPHVDQATTTLGPYYDIARTNALQTYYEIVLPAYQLVEPYALQGYSAAASFTTGTAVPSVLWAWNKTYVFLDGTVWPHLRVIYMENVEPQLVKIGQRLGRYHGNSTQKHGVESMAGIVSKASSSFTKPASTSLTPTGSSVVEEPTAPPSSSAKKSEAPVASEAPTTIEEVKQKASSEPVVAPEAPENGESDVRKTARETVAEDLKAWQEKYAKAADEGAAEIETRVEEIAKRMVRRQARTTGKTLVEGLQQSIVAELATLREDIRNTVAAVQTNPAAASDADEQVLAAVRRAGKEIKKRAQDIRAWRENFDSELHEAVTKAAESHFQILDSIRDLALQKIGMKWAWMDGITYKDWAKYHELKGRFDEWEKDLERLIVTHPALEQAQGESQAIEDEGMQLAQSAVKELSRLKDVASWKVVAGDDTDEFDSGLMKTAAEAAQRAVEEATQKAREAAEAARQAVQDAAEAVQEPIREGFESAADFVTESIPSAADALSGTVSDALPATEEIESATVAAESSVSSISEEASSFILETPAASVQSATSQVSSNIASASEAASSAGDKVSSALHESDTQAAEPDAELPPLEASTIILEETPIVAGNTTQATGVDADEAPVHLPVDEVGETVEVDPALVESTSSATPDAASSAAATVKSALFGAAAQAVPSNGPILDDDTFEEAASVISSMQSDIPRTISSAAQSAYAAALSRAAEQYSQAVSLVSVQIKGTPKPAHEQMLASVTSAYSQAMASASTRLEDALNAAGSLYGSASSRVAPTPTPAPLVDWAHVEAIAAERLNQGRAWAEEQYESAKVAVGLATPTPTSPVDKLLDNARYNYYAGLGVAHARYSEFMDAASSAFSSLTATPTPTDLAGTASSVASVASESAASAASVASDNAESMIWAASSQAASVASAASDNAGSVVSAASSHASSAASVVGENVSSVAAAGSSAAAAGYENAASAAGVAGEFVVEKWDEVLNQVSVQIYGAPTPTPWFESIASVAGEYAAAVTDAAGVGASSVTSAAGTYGTAASEEAAKQYTIVSSIVSELLVGKEPSFTESVYSKLGAAYTGGVASASSLASVASASAASVAGDAANAAGSASKKAASAASGAAEAVKEAAEHIRDEL